MCVKGHKRAEGLSLVEVMLAVVVLGIASMGTLAYQYHATKQIRRARGEIAATRIAQLLLEDWKANGASIYYDPESINMNIIHMPEWDSFDSLGNMYRVYRTVADNNLTMYIIVSRPLSYSIPIPITVAVKWCLDFNWVIYPRLLEYERDEGINVSSVVMTTFARGDEVAD